MDVMLVDDDERLRHLVSRLLQLSGMGRIHEAGDGDEALAALVHFHPEVILTDYHMPRMDGLNFVRALRDRGNNTPVVMLSGNTDPSELLAAVRAGVDECVAKPIDPVILMEKIEQAVESRQQPWRSAARVA